MINWIKKLFAGSPAVREVLYCKKDGKLLTITKEVLEYSAFTGEPAVYKIVKTCPDCGSVVESDIIRL